MTFNIKNPKAKEQKENYKMKSQKSKTFSIYAHNYSWEKQANGTMKVSLGNMSDAGWYWNGNQNEMVGFIRRLNQSKVRDSFLADVKKNNISYAETKPYLLKSADKGDGLYEISGDNVRWHFGQDEEEESYFLEDENLSEKQKDDFYTEYSPITYEQFEKKHKAQYKVDMKKAIETSNSFEELMKKQEDIAEEYTEKVREENGKKMVIVLMELSKKSKNKNNK